MNISRVVIRELRIGVDLVDLLTVPDLDEIAKKEKSSQDKALEKYDFLKKGWERWKGLISPEV